MLYVQDTSFKSCWWGGEEITYLNGNVFKLCLWQRTGLLQRKLCSLALSCRNSCIGQMGNVVMLALVSGIVSEFFRPLQVVSFERSCFRCFGEALVLICTGSLEEPCVLLSSMRDAASLHPGWAEKPLLQFLKFTVFDTVLTGCVVVLPQLSCSCCFLQKEMCSRNH